MEPNCNPGETDMIRILLLFVLLVISPGYLSAATVWVSKTGSATSPYDTEAKGVTTIGAAESYCDSSCSPGDVVMIGDGTYTERIAISHSGSSGGYITYQAKNPWAVTIDGSLQAYQKTVEISGDYIKLVGLRITRGGDYSLSITPDADHTFVKNCFISHAVTSSSVYAYSEVVHNAGSYGLFEDVWAVGGARYIINDGGGSDHNVYRRVVVRWDWTMGNQPVGGFMNYHETTYGGGNNSVFQNCIAIDFNVPAGMPAGDVLGGFAAKYAVDMVISGSISMNMTGCNEVPSCWTGIFDESDSDELDVGTNTISNNVVINATSGYRFVRGGRSNVSNLSVFLSDSTTGYMNNANTITNSLWMDNTTTSTQGITYAYGHFDGSDAAGTNSSTGDSGSLYPIRIETGSAVDGTGSGGADRGAEILKRIGTDGAHFGDTGWNAESATDIWPWPNEDQIVADFSSVASPPPGVYPATSTADRGFCAAGETLTSYIWEALGNTIPEEIYGSEEDTTVPTISAFTMPATYSSLTIPITDWTYSDNVAVTSWCIELVDSSAGCDWLSSEPSTVTGVEGVNNFYAFVRDAALNVSASATDSTTITLPANVSAASGSFSQF